MSEMNLLIMNQSELACFLPGRRQREVEELIAPCCVIDAEMMEPEEWAELLARHNPKVIVGGWSLPQLPDGVSWMAPRLEYLCYVPGTVRDKVSCKMIEKGLLVTNWGRSISRTVAECALLLGLSCVRRSGYWNDRMHHHGEWKDDFVTTKSLFDRRVGIHGYGAIAKELIRLLSVFTSKVTVFSDGVPKGVFDYDGVECSDSLNSLFSENDVIFEVEALTPERVGVVDEALLRSIPEGGAFVNVARGDLVESKGLLNVAKEGRLQIGLDVFNEEPLPATHGLRGCMNVMLSPHIAGPTTDRMVDAGDHAIENLKRFCRGEAVVGPITPEVYERLT
ncbi:hypothetical protein JIN87_16535 [Pelagicoccus mobilis]|uniref:D-isomer specific 2-hydroxyacid dehydrogenase NAD-binding domain-containing protein n=2 Tax=Pelagicoccus mobilis TaxID=415221 RepID=A0A934RZN7_9BACT|nr:hypothetical protein [Pelagicoccus mobilis]